MATILVVDDRDANRRLLNAVLGHLGHNLLEARNGAEALAIVRASACDLVITDLLMPAMDGFEFVRQLRADAAIARTKVIFYTAHYREGQAKRLAEACGVNHVLAKPCEPELLLRVVDGLLRADPPAAPVPPQFADAHLRLVTDKLSENTGQLRIASQRLEVLMEINLELACERDPARLIERLCGAARKLVGATYAFAGAGKDADVLPRHFALDGMDAQTASLIEPPPLDHGIAGAVLGECRTRRLVCAPNEVSSAGLPQQHPPFRSLLCAPIVSPTHAYGWVCVTNEPAADEFGEDDEQLLTMLAALVGRIYENGSRYFEMRSHAERLERELGANKRSAAELLVRNAVLEQSASEGAAQLSALIHRIESLSHALSHSVRAPLRSLDECADALIASHTANDNQQVMEYLQRIRTATQQVRNLVAGLLSVAHSGD